TPIIEVWNKIDLLPRDGEGGVPALASANAVGKVAATVPVSALTGEGIEQLLLTVEATLASQSRIYRVRIPHDAGADVGWLYGHAEIINREQSDEAGQVFEVRVEPRHTASFAARFSGRIEGSDA